MDGGSEDAAGSDGGGSPRGSAGGGGGDDDDDHDGADHVDVPFLSRRYADTNGYDGKYVSPGLIECVVRTFWNDFYPFARQQLLATSGKILAMDTTFNVAKRSFVVNPATGGRERPYKGLSSVMNEHGQIILYNYSFRAENWAETKPHLERLRDRMRRVRNDPTFEPDVIYVDVCCGERAHLNEIWPNALVRLDSFHWFAR